MRRVWLPCVTALLFVSGAVATLSARPVVAGHVHAVAAQKKCHYVTKQAHRKRKHAFGARIAQLLWGKNEEAVPVLHGEGCVGHEGHLAEVAKLA
jgi:hypothetical protein